VIERLLNGSTPSGDDVLREVGLSLTTPSSFDASIASWTSLTAFDASIPMPASAVGPFFFAFLLRFLRFTAFFVAGISSDVVVVVSSSTRVA
jgi:hypothetical protein